jgi:hypothetical protein
MESSKLPRCVQAASDVETIPQDHYEERIRRNQHSELNSAEVQRSVLVYIKCILDIYISVDIHRAQSSILVLKKVRLQSPTTFTYQATPHSRPKKTMNRSSPPLQLRSIMLLVMDHICLFMASPVFAVIISRYDNQREDMRKWLAEGVGGLPVVVALIVVSRRG